MRGLRIVYFCCVAFAEVNHDRVWSLIRLAHSKYGRCQTALCCSSLDVRNNLSSLPINFYMACDIQTYMVAPCILQV